MLVVSLDEYGKFEGNSKNEILAIGGVIFKPDSRQSREEEKKLVDAENKRIKRFFQNVFSRCGTSLPRDLHYINDDNAKTIKNKEAVKKTEECLIRELFDFLKGDGKWRGENAPLGKYYLYYLVGDRDGIISNKNTGNILDDEFATNRYEHMAYRVLENIILYNFKLEDDYYRLQLATRTMPIKDEKIIKQVKELGNKGNNKGYYAITDKTGYRAFLSNLLDDSHKRDTEFDIDVDSINYNVYEENEGFLYLADIVCNVFKRNHGHSFDNEAKTTAKNAIKAINSYLTVNFVKNNYFLWAYNDIDNDFHFAYKNYLSGNYFDALLGYCNIINKQKNRSAIAGIYKKQWILPAMELIENCDDYKNVLFAAKKFENYLYSNDRILDNARDIGNVLNCYFEKCMESEYAAAQLSAKQALYLLNKSQMMYNNHLGNYEEAQIFYSKCLKTVDSFGVDEYFELECNNCVSLLDQLHFEEAKRKAELLCNYERVVNNVKRKIFPSELNIRYGKSLSQLAQCYAFCQEYENADKAFKKALKQFGNDVGNAQRTRSYYLHSLIEQRNKKGYEKVAKDYFGSNNIDEQLSTFDKETMNAFALFVYLKALYTFYLDDINTNTIDNLITFIDEQKSDNDHPWELIYNYAYKIAYVCLKEDKKRQDKFYKKARTCVKPPENSVINAIIDSFDNPSGLTYMYK